MHVLPLPAAVLAVALTLPHRGPAPAGVRATPRSLPGAAQARDTTPASPRGAPAGRSAQFAARVAQAADSVRAGSHVPVRVPLIMYGGADDSTEYAVPTEVEPDRYEIVFGGDPHCEGGNACRSGSVQGWRRPRGARLPRGPKVALPGGRQGVFTEARCQSVCPDSYVTWDEGPYRYRVGVKAGRIADLRQVAATVTARP